MIEYKSGDSHYAFSYSDLCDKYHEIIVLDDAAFIARLPEILHFAIFVCWVKERTHHACADDGVIHELAHLLHIPDGTDLATVRARFVRECELAP